MKKLFITLLAILSFAFLLSACDNTEQPPEPSQKDPTTSQQTPPSGTNPSDSHKDPDSQKDPNPQETETIQYKVSITGEALWESAEAEFFTLGGVPVKSCAIESQTVSISLPKGNYFVQLKGAPESISYSLPILTEEKPSQSIEISKSLNQAGEIYYSILGIVHRSGKPISDHTVIVCYMPENEDEIGFCHEPKTSSALGAIELSTYSGRYHIEINSPTGKDSFEEYQTISSDKRYFCSDLDKLGSASSQTPENPQNPQTPQTPENPQNPQTPEQGDHTHSYRWEVVKEASCEEEGTKKGTCACGSEITEPIPALSHNWKDHNDAKSPTCTEKGYTASKICLNCGTEVKREEIPALGHAWDTGEADVPPTCTSAGHSPSGTCTRCGAEGKNIDLPALGHDLQFSYGEYATCTEEGKNVYKCTRCDYEKIDPIPARGHDLAVFVDREATCHSTGKSRSICMRAGCDYHFESVLPIVDHDYAYSHWKERPTCEKEGKRTRACRFCGAETQLETVPALGHDWKELEILTEPTCEREGKGKHVCLTCEKTLEYTLKKVDHRYSDFVVDAPATENSEGKMSRHCIYCGKKIEEKTFPKLQAEVEYEIRLLRENGMPYSPENNSGFENLEYKIYEGDKLVTSIKADSCKISAKIPKSATKLQVSGLKKGFTATKSELPLDPSKPIVSVWIKGSLQPGNFKEIDGKMVAENPSEPLTVGDAMHDFYIYDTLDSNNYKPLSEMMKGKKLVFLDFFHTECGNCTHYTKLFNNVYQRELYKYHDEILVLMLDVMDYETDNKINIYRNNESYLPRDFISTSAHYGGMNVVKWFTTVNHRVTTPGHVWLDSEGVIYYMDVKTKEEDFVSLVEGYFDTLKSNEKSKETKQISLDMPYVFDKKRY